MRMIIAVDNNVLENKIKNKYYLDYELYIVTSTDMALKYSLEDPETLVIIRYELKGTISAKSVITKIKDKNSNIKIILLIRELTKELKEQLFAKEIFNIVEGKNINFSVLSEIIDNPKMIVYKNNEISKNNKVIIVTGSNGVGKTTTSILLGKCIARIKGNKKIVVVDMDFVYPSLDTYLKIDKNYALVDYINDVLKDNINDIKNYESKDLKYRNLKYILNSKSIGIPSTEVIIKIIEKLELNYDYVILDTSTLMMNKIYNISEYEKYNIVHVIEQTPKMKREFLIDTSYINKDYFTNSIFLLNKKRINTNIKKCEEEYRFVIAGSIGNKIIGNYQYRLMGVLKYIGIIRFEKLKMKIIQKILEFGEEKNGR